ncbi:MAG: hypothetical protein LBS21_02245 [Clostridiales bacterium]|nr:hypothetical protein [Clostridiales bacterium]
MQNRFNQTYKIPYEGIKTDLTLSFAKLMFLFQETAIAHTNSTVKPMKWYSENRLGFVLTNWDVKVLNYPALYEEMTVYTWPLFFKGIMAQRFFQAFDKGGNEIAYANTKWVFSDLEAKKPARIPAEISDSYGGTYSSPHEPDFNFPETEAFKLVNSRQTITRRSDIDSNWHVNNVKYIEWALDCVPDDIYASGNITQMKTKYKKELRQNEEILLETYTKGEEIIILVKSGEDFEVLNAEIYFGLTKS